MTDYLVRRFAIVGPPEVCVERLREIIGYGARNISLSLLSRDLSGQMDSMRTIARDIFPALL